MNKQSGLKTKIIPLEWPPGVVPSELPDFESQARVLRYQALGKACYKANVPSLLLGHHKADEDETIIMRLVGGYRGEGLRGIAEEADIPYCIDVYGAFQTGGRDYTVTWEEKQMIKARQEKGKQHLILPPMKEYRKKGFEYGGIRIYRPLKEYSKQELEATVNEAGVPWVTDPTNSDPTLSIRNTIRYLIQWHLLPKAFDSGSPDEPSALKIAANNIRQRHLRRDEQAEILFQACDIIFLNARSGYLKVRIPLFPAPSEPNFHLLPEDRQRTEIEHVGARLVRLLLSIVSPRADISLQSLEFATKAMFYNFERGSYAGPRKNEEYGPGEIVKTHLPNFTSGGVFCSRIESPSEEVPIPGAQPYILDPEHVWCLSRTQYVSSQPEPVCVVPSVERSYQTMAGKGFNSSILPHPRLPPTQRTKAEEQASSVEYPKTGFPPDRTATEEQSHGKILFPEPEWQLWDGRYWIQVLNPTDKTLKICPLSKVRLISLKKNLDENNGTKPLVKELKKMLNSAGGPRVHHTLPALVDEEDNVLALPTFDLGFPALDSISEVGSLRPRCRVRFKRVVLPDHVKDERIIALKDEKLEGVKPRLSRVVDEEQREKPRHVKKMEEKEKVSGTEVGDGDKRTKGRKISFPS